LAGNAVLQKKVSCLKTIRFFSTAENNQVNDALGSKEFGKSLKDMNRPQTWALLDSFCQQVQFNFESDAQLYKSSQTGFNLVFYSSTVVSNTR